MKMVKNRINSIIYRPYEFTKVMVNLLNLLKKKRLKYDCVTCIYMRMSFDIPGGFRKKIKIKISNVA
jgi:hypothetical protein